jgi:DNA-binding HxlR family transcriptional regulator
VQVNGVRVPMKLGAATLPCPPAGQDAREAACRVRQILDRISDKWSLVVIHQLGSGTKRFTELKRGIDGISQRMLTATLRGLERDGIVHRTVHAVVPPRVDYELTPMGRSLHDAVAPLIGWVYANADDIDAARERYDDATP